MDFSLEVNALTVGEGGIITDGFRFRDHVQEGWLGLNVLLKMKKAAPVSTNGSLLSRRSPDGYPPFKNSLRRHYPFQVQRVSPMMETLSWRASSPAFYSGLIVLVRD